MKKALPNSTAVLVLGIISIVTCACYGIAGLVTGIIALILSANARKLYEENPEDYTDSSYKNMSAGRTCAIIGVSLSALYFLFIVLYFIFIGTLFYEIFSNIPIDNFNY